ncbi:hypothetical protein AB4305_33875, partial [Nocardia sp. 2YAB30]|uniref:hypothetical protein n=1 Tax=unclassified Nocardia TaxID=2637762 RepID=UPI003F9C0AA4
MTVTGRESADVPVRPDGALPAHVAQLLGADVAAAVEDVKVGRGTPPRRGPDEVLTPAEARQRIGVILDGATEIDPEMLTWTRVLAEELVNGDFRFGVGREMSSGYGFLDIADTGGSVAFEVALRDREQKIMVRARLVEGNSAREELARRVVGLIGAWTDHAARDTALATVNTRLDELLAEQYGDGTVTATVHDHAPERRLVLEVRTKRMGVQFEYSEKSGRLTDENIATAQRGPTRTGPGVSKITGEPGHVLGEFFTRPKRDKKGRLLTETNGLLPENAQPVPLVWSIDSAARALARKFAGELVQQGGRLEVSTMVTDEQAGTLNIWDAQDALLLAVVMHPGNSSIKFRVQMSGADPARIDMLRRTIGLMDAWAWHDERATSGRALLAELDTLQESEFGTATVTVEVRGPEANDATNMMGNRRLELGIQVDGGDHRTLRYGEREGKMAELDRGGRGGARGMTTIRSDLLNLFNATTDEPQFVRPEELVAKARDGDAYAVISLLEQFRARVWADQVPTEVVETWLVGSEVDAELAQQLQRVAEELGFDRTRVVAARRTVWLDRQTHFDQDTRDWLLELFSALPTDAAWRLSVLGVVSVVIGNDLVFEVDPHDGEAKIMLKLAEADQVRRHAVVRLIEMVGGWRDFGDRDIAVEAMSGKLEELTASEYGELEVNIELAGAVNDRSITLTFTPAAHKPDKTKFTYTERSGAISVRVNSKPITPVAFGATHDVVTEAGDQDLIAELFGSPRGDTRALETVTPVDPREVAGIRSRVESRAAARDVAPDVVVRWLAGGEVDPEAAAQLQAAAVAFGYVRVPQLPLWRAVAVEAGLPVDTVLCVLKGIPVRPDVAALVTTAAVEHGLTLPSTVAVDPDAYPYPHPRTTTAEVAAAAGVSVATVEAVVSRQQPVDDQFHRRALGAALQLRYHRLPGELSEVRGRTGQVAAAAGRSEATVEMFLDGWLAPETPEGTAIIDAIQPMAGDPAIVGDITPRPVLPIDLDAVVDYAAGETAWNAFRSRVDAATSDAQPRAQVLQRLWQALDEPKRQLILHTMADEMLEDEPQLPDVLADQVHRARLALEWTQVRREEPTAENRARSQELDAWVHRLTAAEIWAAQLPGHPLVRLLSFALPGSSGTTMLVVGHGRAEDDKVTEWADVHIASGPAHVVRHSTTGFGPADPDLLQTMKMAALRAKQGTESLSVLVSAPHAKRAGAIAQFLTEHTDPAAEPRLVLTESRSAGLGAVAGLRTAAELRRWRPAARQIDSAEAAQLPWPNDPIGTVVTALRGLGLPQVAGTRINVGDEAVWQSLPPYVQELLLSPEYAVHLNAMAAELGFALPQLPLWTVVAEEAGLPTARVVAAAVTGHPIATQLRGLLRRAASRQGLEMPENIAAEAQPITPADHETVARAAGVDVDTVRRVHFALDLPIEQRDWMVFAVDIYLRGTGLPIQFSELDISANAIAVAAGLSDGTVREVLGGRQSPLSGDGRSVLDAMVRLVEQRRAEGSRTLPSPQSLANGDGSVEPAPKRLVTRSGAVALPEASKANQVAAKAKVKRSDVRDLLAGRDVNPVTEQAIRRAAAELDYTVPKPKSAVAVSWLADVDNSSVSRLKNNQLVEIGPEQLVAYLAARLVGLQLPQLPLWQAVAAEAGVSVRLVAAAVEGHPVPAGRLRRIRAAARQHGLELSTTATATEFEVSAGHVRTAAGARGVATVESVLRKKELAGNAKELAILAAAVQLGWQGIPEQLRTVVADPQAIADRAQIELEAVEQVLAGMVPADRDVFRRVLGVIRSLAYPSESEPTAQRPEFGIVIGEPPAEATIRSAELDSEIATASYEFAAIHASGAEMQCVPVAGRGAWAAVGRPVPESLTGEADR